jgi:hypothetical protein
MLMQTIGIMIYQLSYFSVTIYGDERRQKWP